MPETNASFDSCNSCKRLGTSRLHELHKSKLVFVSGVEFIRSKHSHFSARVSGVIISKPTAMAGCHQRGGPVPAAPS